MLDLKIPTYLVCPPTHYEVSYIINPWMRPDEWAAHRTTWQNKAEAQWQGLVTTMRGLGWNLMEIPGAAGLPDMVFAANHAFVLNECALISHFATPERAPEEPLAAGWFAAHGFDVRQTKTVQEGAGDILYDPAINTIFVGGGEKNELPFRSAPETVAEIEALYSVKTLQLPLVNPYFYHLDTCFCPLRNGWAMFAPSAFGETGLARIKNIYGDKLIAVEAEDAAHFACNAVVHGRDIVMPRISNELTLALHDLGFTTHQLELDAFIIAGGASRCLTLNLTDRIA
jgi:N-dimethylarginine dimethylaminohydrolase